jgi:hypothetical protein
MRRLVILLLIAALALAGCGSSSSSPGNARDIELTYFPSGTPFVLVMATDPNGKPMRDANDFLAKFPLAKLGLAAAQSSLAKDGVDYERDIKPLLGNPVALGTTQVATFGSGAGSSFLLAFVAKDAGKLAQLTHRSPAPTSEGSYDGAKLYRGGTYAMAINGSTVVLATTIDEVKAALDRHAHGGGISSHDYTQAVSSLPSGTLIQMYGNLAGALSTPKAAKARLIPWVAAIRSYAATLSITGGGVSASFRVNTSGSSLSADQLPLASGSTPPSVAGLAPVAVGIRDVAHLIAFAQAAAQASSPNSYAAFLKRQAAVKGKTGVDFTHDVFPQLSGSAEVDYGSSGVLVRADVADPAAAARTLAKLGTSAGQILRVPRPVTRTSAGFYAFRDGRKTISYGLAGGKFVAGTASVAQLQAFATQAVTPVGGAQGPAAFRISVGPLVSLVLASRHIGGFNPLNPEIQSLLSTFGDISGWAANDASGLSGVFSVPVK